MQSHHELDTKEKDTETINLEDNGLTLPFLFKEMRSGAAYHRIICDENGTPIDYITLAVNDNFLSMLDVNEKQVLNISASSNLSQDELKHWLDIFGPVALEGKTVHYEMFSYKNDRIFSGKAVCPKKGYFLVLFNDVSEQKKNTKAFCKIRKTYSSITDICLNIVKNPYTCLDTNLPELLERICYSLDLDAALLWKANNEESVRLEHFFIANSANTDPVSRFDQVLPDLYHSLLEKRTRIYITPFNANDAGKTALSAFQPYGLTQLLFIPVKSCTSQFHGVLLLGGNLLDDSWIEQFAAYLEFVTVFISSHFERN